MSDTLWGIPIIETDAVTKMTIVAGDWRERVALNTSPCTCPDEPHVFHVKEPSDE